MAGTLGGEIVGQGNIKELLKKQEPAPLSFYHCPLKSKVNTCLRDTLESLSKLSAGRVTELSAVSTQYIMSGQRI